MPERLPQHKHCLNCGRAVSPSKEFCTEECETERIGMLRRKRRQLLILYVGSVVVLLLAVIFSMVRF
jgi:predicted nucleic acid-binding Zn ribbon protein